jgi:hypothetical protein
MRSASSFWLRARRGLLAMTILLAGCAASSSAPLAPAAPAVTAARRPDVLPVEGHVVTVGARQVAYIDAFPSPHTPMLGAPVQLNVSNASSTPLSAVVTHVEPRVDGWLEVEADLVQRADQLATATPFTGQIILRNR